ncbi:MAG: TetR/AcrR family transcriptional regulator, partial [Humibacter sp.]
MTPSSPTPGAPAAGSPAVGSPLARAVPDLRERRRRELTRAIAIAAVELFERNGYAATTIEDIAAAVGISRTTFFRHCSTKEAAVFVDDAGLEPELVSAAAGVSVRHPLRDLEDAWERMTGVFDSDREGRDRFLRVRRLMVANPQLLAAGLERETRLTDRIATTLMDQVGLGLLDAWAVAGSFSLGMRVAFDEWVRRSDGTAAAPSLR